MFFVLWYLYSSLPECNPLIFRFEPFVLQGLNILNGKRAVVVVVAGVVWCIEILRKIIFLACVYIFIGTQTFATSLINLFVCYQRLYV